MSKPIVSVIVPVYNVEKYLKRCMDSLINQSYKDIEIIAINDGSTDNGLKILNEYSKMDSRVKVIDKKNEGLSQTRNIGIDISNGEFITFVDSDDWIELNMIEFMINQINKNQSDVVLCSYVREYKEKSLNKDLGFNEITVFNEYDTKFKLYRRMIGLIDDELKKPESLDSLITAWGKLYKKSIIKENNIKFLDTSVIGTEDLIFNVYVFNYVKNVVLINKPLYHYWKGNINSLTSGYKDELTIQWKKNHMLIKEFLNSNNESEVFFRALNNRICLSTLGLGLNECSTSNSNSIFKKIKNINNILNEKHIKSAFSKFDFKYLPIHWKIFYMFNKYGFSTGSYLILRSINILRRVI